MGQLFLPDNFPTPVVASTTTLTLAATSLGGATRIGVGGQQYTLASQLTLNAATVGANGLDAGALGNIQLWYVYAVVNATTFALALVASQTAPSSGPTMPSGYGTAYKLVGAFYTNGSSQVGSIVTITGQANSGWMSYTPVWSSGGTAPAIGNGALTGSFRRLGDSWHVKVAMNSGSTTTYGGANLWLFSIPSGAFNPASGVTNEGGGYGGANCQAYVTVGGASYHLYQGSVLLYNFSSGVGNNLAVASTGGATLTNWNSTNPAAWAAGDNTQAMAIEAIFGVLGFNTTLL